MINLVGILFPTGKQTFNAVQDEGARHVAEAARAASARALVHVSAIGADKDAPSVYARSKAAGETAVAEVFPAAVILRPSVVFGPEDDFFNRFGALPGSRRSCRSSVAGIHACSRSSSATWPKRWWQA